MPRKPDPITQRQRHRTGAQKLQARVEAIDKKESGFNFWYWFRLERAVERSKKNWLRAGLTPEETLLKQALLITRMGLRFVDHSSKRTVDIENEALKKEDKKPLNHEQVQAEHEHEYDKFLDFFKNNTGYADPKSVRLMKGSKTRPEGMKGIRKYSKDAFAAVQYERILILQEMDHLHKYIFPPRFVLKQREQMFEKHAGKMKQLIRAEAAEPEAFLIKETMHVIKEPVDPNRKAIKLCQAAGIYADVMERYAKENWSMAYSEAMLKMYDLIASKPTILRLIVRMQ